MPFCEANGLNLYYEREGCGPRLLYISGTGSDLRNKPNLTDGPIVERFEVLAYDQRGLGRSDVPVGPYSMADYADDAAGLLDALGWDRCPVLGVSFGGMVAQELALRHADRVSRLVLACTSSGGVGGSSYPFHTLHELSDADRAVRQIEVLDTRWDAEWRRTHDNQVSAMLGHFRTDPPSPASEVGSAAHGAWLQLEARSHHDTAGRLSDISCPTLVAGGRFDGTAPPANSEYLAARIPGAELAMFDGGHLFLIQDRAAMPAIISFLEG